MKLRNFNSYGTNVLACLAVVSTSLPLLAQSSVPAELARQAQEACVRSAEAKGFQLKEIVLTEAYDATKERVKVVLNLLRDGNTFKLTCGYTKGSGIAAFNEDLNVTQTSPTTDSSYWWGWPLTLLGIPLLLWLTNRRLHHNDEAANRSSYQSRTSFLEKGTERVIGSNSDVVEIYSGPGNNYNVTGSLRRGQRVRLMGRQEHNWVQLEQGGWIPDHCLEISTRTP